MFQFVSDCNHGTFKLSNQIVQFTVNIFHTHLRGGEQVNLSIAFPKAQSHGTTYLHKSVLSVRVYSILMLSTLCYVNPILIFMSQCTFSIHYVINIPKISHSLPTIYTVPSIFVLLHPLHRSMCFIERNEQHGHFC